MFAMVQVIVKQTIIPAKYSRHLNFVKTFIYEIYDAIIFKNCFQFFCCFSFEKFSIYYLYNASISLFCVWIKLYSSDLSKTEKVLSLRIFFLGVIKYYTNHIE